MMIWLFLLNLTFSLILAYLVISPLWARPKKQEYRYVALDENEEWAIYVFGVWWTESEIMRQIDWRGPPEWESLFGMMLCELHAGMAKSKACV